MDKVDWKRTARDRGFPLGENRKEDLSAEEIYDRCPREITVLLGWFITGHLARLYRLFEGDLISVIVLGEIAHHNIGSIFDQKRMSKKGEVMDWNHDYSREALQPCNSFSISTATDIPRETCRRKIEKLLQSGFLERHPGGGYTITKKVVGHFREFNRETFLRWSTVAKELDKVILNASEKR